MKTFLDIDRTPALLERSINAANKFKSELPRDL